MIIYALFFSFSYINADVNAFFNIFPSINFIFTSKLIHRNNNHFKQLPPLELSITFIMLKQRFTV